jgi:ABC-2 type transport system ATP-binding protein
MRRRLDLITSLIVAPWLLFLDEPTTGLDPHSRNEVWDTIRDLVGGGTSVLLTTQYLDEADQLADDIALVDQGAAIASGTPRELKSELGERMEVVLAQPGVVAAAGELLGRLAGAAATTDLQRCTVTFPAAGLRVPEIVRVLDRAGYTAADASVHKPTLDEVFLRLTGHAAEPAATEDTELAGSVTT